MSSKVTLEIITVPPANCSPLPYQYDLRAHCTVHTVESLLTRHLAVADLSSGSFF